MASADPSRQALLHSSKCFIALPCPWGLPGYPHVLSLHVPTIFTPQDSVQFLDFGLSCSLILLQKPEMVSVRWGRGLPAPSFSPLKPHSENLGVQLYPSHCRADSGLSPVRTCARRAHMKLPAAELREIRPWEIKINLSSKYPSFFNNNALVNSCVGFGLIPFYWIQKVVIFDYLYPQTKLIAVCTV